MTEPLQVFLGNATEYMAGKQLVFRCREDFRGFFNRLLPKPVSDSVAVLQHMLE